MIVYVTEISFFKFKEMEIAAQVVVGVMGCFGVFFLQFYLQKDQLFFYFYPQNLNYVNCYREK